MASITVGYRELGAISGVSYYHKFIIYTDSNGNQWVTSGWAGGAGESGSSDGSQSGSSGSGSSASDNGDIITTGGTSDPRRYDPSYPDHPKRPNGEDKYPGKDYKYEDVKTGDDLSDDWKKIQDAMDDIAREGHQYRIADQNSNTTADEALRRANLPEPSGDDLGDNWAPGSGNNLPGGADDFSFEDLFNKVRDFLDLDVIGSTVNDWWNNARTWVPRRDPLTLDLDGDGLETVGIDSTNPILFDHDGDGIANATGWIKPDDGFLVLDRNGDGLINNGTELFGDSTPLASGGNAADGFAALAQEDSNGDGVVNAQDANWANLRVWKDADSDGVTDEGELHSLESQGIAGLVVAKTENTTRLANGNQIADLGHFIRTDGSEGTLGQITGGLADIDLADNPFFRSFSDTIPSTPETVSLPDMQGSGALRDLREASSLSPDLTSALAAYAAADTRAGQMALIDNVISQWAGSTGFQTSIEKASEQGFRLTYLIPGLSPADLSSGSFVSSSGSGSGIFVPPSEAELQRRAALLAQQAAITQLIGTLEKFNGLTFVNVEPTGVRTGASQFISASSGGSSSGGTLSTGGGQVYVSLSSTQLDFMNRAYDALRQSVYDGLLLQTRLKPYLDAVTLTISDTDIGMDLTNVDVAFQTRYGQAPAEAVRDLLDLQRIASSNMNGMGWEGLTQLRGWLMGAVADSALQSALMPALAEFGYPSVNSHKY